MDRITSFPEEAEEPRVVIVSRKRFVVSLALYGDQSEGVLREYAEYLRDRLLQDPDITQVELVGVRNYEISVEISQDKLRTYNLTLEEVAQRIGRTSVELPGGAVKTPGGDILIRVKERKDYGHEFGKIPIITANDGTQVLLEDIADVKDGFEETDNARHIQRQTLRNGRGLPDRGSNPCFSIQCRQTGGGGCKPGAASGSDGCTSQ